MKYGIFCGAKETMESVAKRGVRGLNLKTHKWQVIDKTAKYEVMADGIGYFLTSDKDLKTIAKKKGLII